MLQIVMQGLRHILSSGLTVGCEDVDWICLPQDSVQWWDLVKTEMNICVP